MSQYSTGTASVTNGSATVTGSGTLWLANVTAGNSFTVAGDGVMYDVASVDSDTQVTLSVNYAGVTASGAVYAIGTGFTVPDSFPEMSQGDIETATIFTRGMRKIQGKFSGIVSDISGKAAIAGQTFTGDIEAPKITASTGILFGTDTAAANTLDDYEEGTWTPALVFGGGSSGVTYGPKIGNYTKVGNLVYAHAFFTLTSKGTSIGDADITNLPFPSNGASNTYNVCSVWSEAVSFSDVPQSYTIPGTTKITLQELTTAGVRTRLNESNYSDTSLMMVSVTYRTP